MDSPTTKIIDRLERYTDHGRDAAREIARQVLIALDIDNSLYPIVMSDREHEEELERENTLGYLDGHRVGYMEAMDDIKLALDTSDVESEANRLKASYLDNH